VFVGVSVCDRNPYSVFTQKHIVEFTHPGPPVFLLRATCFFITVSTMVERFGAGPPRATVIICFVITGSIWGEIWVGGS
jgi:hypothetical protein